MPFQSKAQARYLFAKHPKVAKEFAKKTPSIKALPEHKEESPAHERAESPAFERQEERAMKPKAKRLFGRK